VETRENVERFLEEFKQIMKTMGYMPIPRESYNKTLSELNLTPIEAKEIINGLNFKNYVSGPDEDYDNKGKQIWFFGYNVKNSEIYIKLSNDYSFKAKCISFHVSDRKLSFPYFEQGGCQ